MNELQKGYQITAAFHYIQQVFVECQKLLLKADNLMAPEWKTVYGNLITRDVSKSLQDPKHWIADAIFRVYENEAGSSTVKGITIAFWGENVDQPVIVAGKIDYADSNKRMHWDLWNAWFAGNDEESETWDLDGHVRTSEMLDFEHIKATKIFALPLIDIRDDEVLMEKIIKPLQLL